MSPILPWTILGVAVAGLLSTGATITPRDNGVHAGLALSSTSKSSDTFGGKLTMQVDRNKIDLKARRLEVQMNRAVSRVVLKVIGENNEVLAEETVRPPESSVVGEPIAVSWAQRNETPPARLELYGYDVDENWVGVAIVPWNVKIPHEEVHFESGKAKIDSAEIQKLQDSLQKINEAIERYRELGSLQLFIAGHTDTVGSAKSNVELSRRRAYAIAEWFIKNGIAVPVAFEGFGESALLVETKDEVDEPRNRRVDYILSVEVPTGKSGIAPAWKYVSRPK
jgi:outer membrane protein OmpA-like peptidoglycan-associated protein